jgi:hypothetical protein
MAINSTDNSSTFTPSQRDDRRIVSEADLQQINNERVFVVADTGGPAKTPLREDVEYLNQLRAELDNFAYVPVGPFKGAAAGRSTFYKVLDGEYLFSRSDQAKMSFRAAEALDRLGGYLSKSSGPGLWLPGSGSNRPNSEVTYDASRSLNIELRRALAFWAGIPRMFGDYSAAYENKSRSTLDRLYRDEDAAGGVSARDGGIQLNHLRPLTQRAIESPRVPAIEDVYGSAPVPTPRPSVSVNDLGEPILRNGAVTNEMTSFLNNNPDIRQRYSKLLSDYGIPQGEVGGRLLNALREQESKAGVSPQWTKSSIATLFRNLSDGNPGDVHNAFVSGRSPRTSAPPPAPSTTTAPAVPLTNSATSLKNIFNDAYAGVVPKDTKVASEARDNFFERFDAGGGFDPKRSGDSAAYQKALVAAAATMFPGAPKSADGSPRLSREEVKQLLGQLSDGAPDGPISRAFSNRYAAETGRAPVDRAAKAAPAASNPASAVSTAAPKTTAIASASRPTSSTPLQKVDVPKAAVSSASNTDRTSTALFSDIKVGQDLFPNSASLFNKDAGYTSPFGISPLNTVNRERGRMDDLSIIQDSAEGAIEGVIEWSGDTIKAGGQLLKTSALGYAGLTALGYNLITGQELDGADKVYVQASSGGQGITDGAVQTLNQAERFVQDPGAFVQAKVDEASVAVANGKASEVSKAGTKVSLDIASTVAGVGELKPFVELGKSITKNGLRTTAINELFNPLNFKGTKGSGGLVLAPSNRIPSTPVKGSVLFGGSSQFEPPKTPPPSTLPNAKVEPILRRGPPLQGEPVQPPQNRAPQMAGARADLTSPIQSMQPRRLDSSGVVPTVDEPRRGVNGSLERSDPVLQGDGTLINGELDLRSAPKMTDGGRAANLSPSDPPWTDPAREYLKPPEQYTARPRIVGRTPQVFGEGDKLKPFAGEVLSRQLGEVKNGQRLAITAEEAASGKYPLVDKQLDPNGNAEFYIWRDATYVESTRTTYPAGYMPLVRGQVHMGHIVPAVEIAAETASLGRKNPLMNEAMNLPENYRIQFSKENIVDGKGDSAASMPVLGDSVPLKPVTPNEVTEYRAAVLQQIADANRKNGVFQIGVPASTLESLKNQLEQLPTRSRGSGNGPQVNSISTDPMDKSPLARTGPNGGMSFGGGRGFEPRPWESTKVGQKPNLVFGIDPPELATVTDGPDSLRNLSRDTSLSPENLAKVRNSPDTPNAAFRSQDPLAKVPDNYKPTLGPKPATTTTADPLAAATKRGAASNPNIPDWFIRPENHLPNYETQQILKAAERVNNAKSIPFDPSPIVGAGISIGAATVTGLVPNNMAPIKGPVGPILAEYLANPSAFNQKYVNNGLPNTVEPWLVDNATGKTTLGAAPSLYDAVKREALANGYKSAKQSSFFVDADGKVMVSAIDPGGVKREIELVLPASSRPLDQRFKLEPYNTLTANPTEPGQYGKIGATFTVNGGLVTSATDIGVNLNRSTTPMRADVNVLKLDQTSPALTQGLFYKQTNHLSANALTATESYPGRSLVMDPTRPKVSALSGFVTEGFERTRFNGVGGSLALEHTAGAEGASLNRVSLTAPDGAAVRLTAGQQFFGGQVRERLGNVASPFDYSPDPANMLFLQLRGQAGSGVLPAGVDGLPVVESPERGMPLLRLFEPGVKTDVPKGTFQKRADLGGVTTAAVNWESGGVPDDPFVDLRADGSLTPVSFNTSTKTAFADPLAGLSDVDSGFLPTGTQYIASAGNGDAAQSQRPVDANASEQTLSDLGLSFDDPVNEPVGARVAELEADAANWKRTGGNLETLGGWLGKVKNPAAQAGATLLNGVGAELSSGEMTDGKRGNAATGIAGSIVETAGKVIDGNGGAALSAAGSGLRDFGDRNVNGVNGDGAVGAIATVADIANKLGGGKDPVLGATSTIASGVSESMRLGAKGAGAGQELAELRNALATETDKQTRIGLEAEIKSKEAEEKAYRDAQGSSTRSAIADGVGAAVGGPVGAIIGKVDDVIDVANRTTTDGVPDNAGFAIGGAVAQAIGGATNNPVLSGLGTASTGVSNAMVAGTKAAEYGRLATAEIAKNLDAYGNPIANPQSNQQIIDFAQSKEAQLRAQQAGANWGAVGAGLGVVATVTNSKPIGLAAQTASAVGTVVPQLADGTAGNGLRSGVAAGLQIAGGAIGGGFGKGLAAAGSASTAFSNIAKGGFNNITNGAGSLISAVTSFLPEPIAKAGSIIGTALTAFSNPLSAVPALLMQVIPGAKDLPAKLLGTYKGKMGDNAQAFDINNARIRRDNDDDFFVDELQADGTYKNVQRFNHKGYFNKASEASQVNVADFDGDGKLDFSFKDNQYLNRAGADGAVRFVNGAEEAYAKAQTELKAKMEVAPLAGGVYAVAGDSDGTPTWSFVDKDGFTVKGPGAITYEDQLAQGWVGVDQGGGNVVRVATASLHYGNRGWKTLVVNNPAIDANMSAATTAATTAQQKQWVSDIYYQELGRPVDAPSATNWELMFANGTATTDSMRGALRNTPEGQSYANAQTTLAYREVLGREPDPLGLATWAGQIASGAFTVAQVRAGLASSAEGQARLAIQASVATPLAAATAPTASAQQKQWVSDIYYQELGRGVDPEAATNWGAMFANGSATIESMRSALRASPEGGNYATTQTILAYREVLGREPDAGGLANNAALLRSGGQTVEQMRAALANSAEGQARVAAQANAVTQANAVAQADAAAQANAPLQATVAAAPAVLATVTPAAVVETQAPEFVAEPEAAAQQRATVTPPATVEVPTYFDVPALAPPLQAPALPTEAQVASAYWEILNREPDEGGWANNVALINSGAQTIEQVRATLAASNEAKVNRAHQDFFGRGADPEGLQYWWNLMRSGQLNEAQLRDSFAQIATQQKAA